MSLESLELVASVYEGKLVVTSVVEGDNKCWWMMADSMETYDHARAHLLILNLNVGQPKKNMIDWYAFKVYAEGTDPDPKTDGDF